MTAITVPTIDSDKVRKAKEKQAELQATVEALTAEFHSLNQFQDQQRRADLMRQIHETNAECLRLGREEWDAKKQAREDATQTILRSKEYQQIIADAIADWRSELEPWLRLIEAHEAAHSRAVVLPQPPATKAREVAELRAFEDELRRLKVIK